MFSHQILFLVAEKGFRFSAFPLAQLIHVFVFKSTVIRRNYSSSNSIGSDYPWRSFLESSWSNIPQLVWIGLHDYILTWLRVPNIFVLTLQSPLHVSQKIM